MKQKNNVIKYFKYFALIIALVFAFNTNLLVIGETADQLAQQKQEKQKKLDELNKKISSYQQQIAAQKKLSSTLKNEISILNLEITQTEAQLEATETKIDQTNYLIAEVTDEIIKTEKQIVDQKDLLKTLILEINDLDQRSPLEIALENNNFDEFLDQVQYLASIQEKSQEVLTTIKKLKLDLDLQQSSLKKTKEELDILKTKLVLVEASLSGQRKAKQQILDQTKGQERVYQKLLAESENVQDQINKEIFDLEVAIREKMGNRRLPAMKGLIAWPMDGTLTQGFGNTGFTALGYTYHNGIDIAAPAGTSIYAVYDGTVLDTGTGNGSYGNWVTIKHTVATSSGPRQLISLYGHMSSFIVKAGQTIKQGDLVGFEGNTGNTTRILYGPHRGYHIHFTLFDAEGYGVADGKYPKIYGPYRVPYGYAYNPLEFL